MAIEQQNGDYDIKTSAATVFNKTADAATAGPWEFDLRIGDGTKNLHTDVASLTVTVTVAGETINGGSASTSKDAGVLRARLSTSRVHVADGEAVTVTLLSSNNNDTDVDVTVTPRRVADVTAAGKVAVPDDQKVQVDGFSGDGAQQAATAARGRRVWWVDGVNGNDANDGKSKGTAFQTVAAAVAAAGVSNDEVIVVSGMSQAEDFVFALYGGKLTILSSNKNFGDVTLGPWCEVDGGGCYFSGIAAAEFMGQKYEGIAVRNVRTKKIDAESNYCIVEDNFILGINLTGDNELLLAGGRTVVRNNIVTGQGLAGSTVVGICQSSGINADNQVVVSGENATALSLGAPDSYGLDVNGGYCRASGTGTVRDIYCAGTSGKLALKCVDYTTIETAGIEVDNITKADAAAALSADASIAAMKAQTNKLKFTPDNRLKAHVQA